MSAKKKMCFIQTSARVYIDYIPARLTTGKEWYIHYSVIDPQTRKLRRIRKKVNYIPSRERRNACSLPKEVKFYSLKDTGITNMLEHGVPINTVQKQADHSSVAMTAIYVGHGKGANKELRTADIFQFEKE